MAGAVADVVAVSPYVVFTDQRAGEADTVISADLESPEIVREDVGGVVEEWRSFDENDVFTWNV